MDFLLEVWRVSLVLAMTVTLTVSLVMESKSEKEKALDMMLEEEGTHTEISADSDIILRL